MKGLQKRAMYIGMILGFTIVFSVGYYLLSDEIDNSITDENTKIHSDTAPSLKK